MKQGTCCGQVVELHLEDYDATSELYEEKFYYEGHCKRCRRLLTAVSVKPRKYLSRVNAVQF